MTSTLSHLVTIVLLFLPRCGVDGTAAAIVSVSLWCCLHASMKSVPTSVIDVQLLTVINGCDRTKSSMEFEVWFVLIAAAVATQTVEKLHSHDGALNWALFESRD